MKAYVMPFVADIVVFDGDLPRPAAVVGARDGAGRA